MTSRTKSVGSPGSRWLLAAAGLAAIASMAFTCESPSDDGDRGQQQPGRPDEPCNDLAPTKCVAGAECFAGAGIDGDRSICRAACNSDDDCEVADGFTCAGCCFESPSVRQELGNGTCFTEFARPIAQAGESCAGAVCVEGTHCINLREDGIRCHLLCNADADCGMAGGRCIVWDLVSGDRFAGCEFAAAAPPGSSPAVNQATPGGGEAYAGQAACRQLLSGYDSVLGHNYSCPISLDAAPDTFSAPQLISGPCLRDDYVDAAVQFCWAAECYLGLPGAASQASSAAQQAIAELSNATALCSSAPALGSPQRCSTEDLVPCPDTAPPPPQPDPEPAGSGDPSICASQPEEYRAECTQCLLRPGLDRCLFTCLGCYCCPADGSGPCAYPAC